jgi:hypothetical protein
MAAAKVPSAKSICDSVHPPKMSPLAFASRGIATVRRCAPPGGCGISSAMVILLRGGAGRFRRQRARSRKEACAAKYAADFRTISTFDGTGRQTAGSTITVTIAIAH